MFRSRATFLAKKYLLKCCSFTGLSPYSILFSNTTNPKTLPLNRNNKDSLLAKNLTEITKISNSIISNNKLPIFSRSYDILFKIPSCDLDLGVVLRLSPVPNSVLTSYIDSLPSSTIVIYTDGSKIKNSRSVGAAYYCPQLGISKKISLYKGASIFTAECYALNQALNVTASHANTNFILLTDSQSVIKAIQDPIFDFYSNQYLIDIKTKVTEFTLNNPQNFIKFIWIPSHTGIVGNEMVDALAKEATNLMPVSNAKIPFTDFIWNLKREAKLSTEETIKAQASIKGIDYFRYYYRNTNKPWYASYNLPRDFIVFVNRGRSNHYNLNASLARINFITDSACLCGADSQDLNHIIWQCPLYDNQRKILIELRNKYIYCSPYCVSSFFYKPDIVGLKLIHRFLKKCDIKI